MFDSLGFLAIPGFATPDEVTALRLRAAFLVDGFDPSSSSSVFSTRNQARKKLSTFPTVCALNYL